MSTSASSKTSSGDTAGSFAALHTDAARGATIVRDPSVPLRILHCMRAPVGGLFRHVLDLASEQAGRGHAVGIIADATTADALTVSRFRAIEPKLRLGLALVPMSRQPGIGDVAAGRSIYRFAKPLRLDVLHGHGAKGGAYARLAAATLRLAGQPIGAFYTPHGGSLHYRPGTVAGTTILGLEKVLGFMTAGFIFESDYARRAYAARIGAGSTPVRVIPNGLKPEDFAPHQPTANAADFLFIGELRDIKGVDVLLRALADIKACRRVSAVIVGSGPHGDRLKALARDLGLGDCVTFPGAMPARAALPLGRCLVVPSLAESFPYVVLEAGAAGAPLIATNVGGIPEIVAGTRTQLIAPGDAHALAASMSDILDNPQQALDRARELCAAVERKFTVAAMTDAALSFYRDPT